MSKTPRRRIPICFRLAEQERAALASLAGPGKGLSQVAKRLLLEALDSRPTTDEQALAEALGR